MVDSSLWRIPKVQMTAIVDIFNAIGEKLEKWQSIKNKEELLNLLEVASLIMTRVTMDAKVESVKVLMQIL